jgi:hypothetical protein
VVAVERAAAAPAAMESAGGGVPEIVVSSNLRRVVHAVSIAKVQVRGSAPGMLSAITSRLRLRR